jgi:putative ABC transport system substrate-binding protein
LGWIEGKNIIFEYRYADNHLERLPELAAELVRLNVDIIVAAGTLAPIAAKRATSTIPHQPARVIRAGGLVNNLARLGGNVTGVSLMSADLGAQAAANAQGAPPEPVPGSGHLERCQPLF